MKAPIHTKPEQVNVRACLLGERINTKRLEQTPPPIALAPLTIRAGANGYAVLFRFGAAVMFGLSTDEEEKFIESMQPLVSQAYSEKIEETNEIIIDANDGDLVTPTGVIKVKEFTIERIQLIAEVLGDALVLDYYESHIGNLFDNLEPLAEQLKNEGKCGAHGKVLTKHIGEILLTLIKTVGRIEISEKPDVLWECPDMERLYARLAEEYEIRDRNTAFNRKLDIASKAIETLVNLDQHLHSSKLEWYVVILVAMEVLAIMFG